jgi:hypothetical protein
LILAETGKAVPAVRAVMSFKWKDEGIC